jgi:hypothetical protein
MTLADSAFPSSQAFDLINNSMQDSPADKKDAIKKAGAIFAFTLKNKEGTTQSWYIDLKNEGKVEKGAAPSGGKADGEYKHSISRKLTLAGVCDFRAQEQ